jgi:hypothetical protein
VSSRDAPLAVLQQSMRVAYVRGAPGVAVSGIVWVVAGVAAGQLGIAAGFAALFFGGMLIQPLGVAISRLLGAKQPAERNALDLVAIESLAILFVGLLIAYRLIGVAPSLVFPTVALAIGARYVLFRTLYEDTMYWALGGVLMAIGTGGMLDVLADKLVPVVVGFAELAFAAMLFGRARRSPA